MTTESGVASPRIRIAAFAAFTSAYFLSYFFRSSNAIIAPDLQRDLLLGANELGFMTGAYFLSFAAIQIPLGHALDKWGARWVTTAGLLVAALGGFVFAGAEKYEVLIVGRLLIGMGMGSVLMGAMKSFDRHFTGNTYRSATSALVGIGSLGAVAAATPLAVATQALGWRGAVTMASVLVLVAAMFVAVADSGDGTRQVTAVPLGGEVPSRYSLLRDRRLWALAALNVFMSGMLFSVQGLWAGPFLFDTLAFDSGQVGRYLTMLSVGAALGFGLAGTIANRLGVKRVTLTAAVVLQASIWGILFLRPPTLQLAFFLFGAAGAFNILLLTQTRYVVPVSHLGRAVTFVNLAGIGGGFVLQWLLGAVLSLVGQNSGGTYPRSAYFVGFGAAAVCLLITTVVYAIAYGRETG